MAVGPKMSKGLAPGHAGKLRLGSDSSDSSSSEGSKREADGQRAMMQQMRALFGQQPAGFPQLGTGAAALTPTMPLWGPQSASAAQGVAASAGRGRMAQGMSPSGLTQPQNPANVFPGGAGPPAELMMCTMMKEWLEQNIDSYRPI